MANPQFSGALMSAVNQNNIALANISFEFPLIKIEAAKEYHGLGMALSPRRRENAEAGSLHRTARKLGSLFEQLIPPISVLAEAYGQRVSEIAAASINNFDNQTNYGPFSQYAGVDGTSIYAAATSGSSVIALHLLACMLARTWSGPEATSIWVELVADRKKDIEENADASQMQGIVARMAAQQEITRSQLAEWDTSARSWLRSADEVKKFEQTQLRLILKDSGLSLNTGGTTYESVIGAWTMAMTSLQKLILGTPQNISKGSILLGLMSWHIYPDLNVVDPTANIQFNDPLVKFGGVITLGLHRMDSTDPGVHWSLALSHLRFYGGPVAVKRSIGSDTTRVTHPEMHMIALGCILSSWDNPASFDLIAAAHCFDALGQCLYFDMPVNDDSESQKLDQYLPWLRLLVNAARALISSEGPERKNALDLVEHGRRRGRKFLDENVQNQVPLFGLANPLQLFSVTDELGQGSFDTETSIKILRNLAEQCKLDPDDCIIRYHPETRWNQKMGFPVYERNYEITTAIPHQKSSGKRGRNGQTVTNMTHSYWVHYDRTVHPSHQIILDIEDRDASTMGQDLAASPHPTTPGSVEENTTLPSYVPGNFSTQNPAQPENNSTGIKYSPCFCYPECGYGDETCTCKEDGIYCTSQCSCVRNATGLVPYIRCQNLRPRRKELCTKSSDCYWLQTDSIKCEKEPSGTEHKFRWRNPPTPLMRKYNDHRESSRMRFDTSAEKWRYCRNTPGTTQPNYDLNSQGSINYRFLAGDRNFGLYVSDLAPDFVPSLDILDLTQLLRSGAINRQKLISYLTSVPRNGPCLESLVLDRYPCLNFFKSLKALAAASELCKEWPEATVSIDITKRSLAMSYWTPPLDEVEENIQNYGTTRQGASNRSKKFACIAMLESGTHDLFPEQLSQVMAMAAGNSIYVAESLLQDPTEVDRSELPAFRGIRRILGSLDRPGIAMLVPPQAPQIRSVDVRPWKLVQHAAFDGSSKDSFKTSSIHLSFTDFEVPLAISPGAYDAEVVLLEALISLHEGRDWVADLDIIGSLDNTRLKVPIGCDCERLPESQSLEQLVMNEFGGSLRSIESWDELLICKENLLSSEIGVVRAYNNWLSRLAAAAICANKGYSTILLPSHCICQKCSKFLIAQEMGLKGSSGRPDVLIV